MSASKNVAIPLRRRPARKAPRLSDARSLRSQGLLKQALLALIADHMFADISIRDITSEAGLSYPTFFNHYDHKDDLFLDIARTEIVELLAAFREGRTSPDWRPGEGVCAHVSRRRNLWRTLLTAGASSEMRTEFIRRSRELEHEHPDLGHGFPIEIVGGVIASGTFEIIAWWLGQDEDYPIAKVADMLEALVIEPALNLPRGYFTDRAGLSILRR